MPQLCNFTKFLPQKIMNKRFFVIIIAAMQKTSRPIFSPMVQSMLMKLFKTRKITSLLQPLLNVLQTLNKIISGMKIMLLRHLLNKKMLGIIKIKVGIIITSNKLKKMPGLHKINSEKFSISRFLVNYLFF